MSVKNEIEKRKVLEIEVNSKVQVSDEDCRGYYEKHLEQYTTQGRTRFQQILLLIRRSRMDDREIESLRAKILSIREEIINGSDFAEMAKQHSQGPNGKNGGDCGYFRKGELLPEIENVTFSLPIGKMSQVIQTNLGFHLIRVTERDETRAAPFEEVKENIRKQLFEKAYADRMEAWIQELKDRAYIDIRLWDRMENSFPDSIPPSKGFQLRSPSFHMISSG